MTSLREAAQAVLDRWDSPAWEWLKQGPTAALMTDLRAALATQSTHSADCYKWHHECAIARVEELKSLCEEMLSELYVYRASKHFKDVTAAIRARETNA